MSRVMELEEQIKKLQDEKAKIYSEERKAALSEIKEKIALFQITAKELGLKPGKSVDGRRSRNEDKPAGTKNDKTRSKKVAAKSYKASGIYFDLDGRKIPAGRGRPPKEVTAFAVAKGIPIESLKKNADGSPFKK